MYTLGIEAFLAVVRHGSLTEAANSLFLSQSTLSHRLAELEREIGMKLIDRGRGVRALTLTDQGKEFLIRAKRWEDLVQDIKIIKSQTLNLTLAIGAVDTVHTFVLPPLYQALREQMPNVNIRIRTYNSTELYLQVDRGEIDIAFPLIDLPMKTVVVQKFYSEPRVILRKEHSPSQPGEIIDFKRLDPDAEIFFAGDAIFHRWYEQWKGKRGYPAIYVDTAQLLIPLLNQDGAWAIVPLCMAKKLTAHDTFSYYQMEVPPPERVCYKIQSHYPKTSILESLLTLEACLASLLQAYFVNGKWD